MFGKFKDWFPRLLVVFGFLCLLLFCLGSLAHNLLGIPDDYVFDDLGNSLLGVGFFGSSFLFFDFFFLDAFLDFFTELFPSLKKSKIKHDDEAPQG